MSPGIYQRQFNQLYVWNFFYRLFGVMVCVFALGSVDRGFDPNQIKPETIRQVFAVSPMALSIPDKDYFRNGSCVLN